MKKEKILFTIADKNNEPYLKKFVASLRKFHTEEELPLIIVDQARLDKISDPYKFYRMTPMIARDLIREYDLVIKMDCDSIVCGKLDHLWEDRSYDVGGVLNSNPKEPVIQLWDIHPANYLNCGLVAMTNADFVNKWWILCNSPHFNSYQYREQDILNILVQYGCYDIKCFDASNEWFGLVSKGWWMWIEKVQQGEEVKLILKKGDREWPMDGDKTIKVLHWAGGQDPHKMEFNTKFQPEVVEYLNYLVSDSK